jgi:3-oxoacyl-[acyl-carrier protein] reductase
MLIKDKVIAITGGGRGLGRAMALAFADKGGHVALLDLNQADLDDTRALIEARSVRAASYVTNVADESSITKDGLLVKAKDGQVVSKMSLDQWNAVIAVDLTGVFLGGREAAERMIKLGNGGVIINITSISREGNMGQTNYSAAKAGVAAMTVVWSKELARHGIRTGAIAPGYCATEILTAMKPEVLEKVTAPVPLKRLGQPSEIAHTAVYIAENDFFSGRVVEVDGGLRF